MIESLQAFFTKPVAETKTAVPEGVCPNCWGEQEYDTRIRDMYKDKQIDVNNKAANHSFIQNFVVTQLDGIRLKKGTNGMECSTCRMKE